MRLIKFLILALLFLDIGLLRAASLSLKVGQEKLTLEDTLEVEVTLEEGSVNEYPKFEESDAFTLRENGVSSQTQIINGSMTRRLVFSFLLLPKKEGIFNLGPARLNIGRDLLVSNVVQIQVNKGEQFAGAEEERPFFLRTEVDKENPFVGEQILYTFRLFVREGVNIRSLNLTSLPDFQGFWKEELGKQTNYETTIKGARWSVTELKFALFPTREGALKIGESLIEGQMVVPSGRRERSGFDSFFDDGFFQRGKVRPVRIQSKAVVVNAKALPTIGRPIDYRGLVGKFLLDATLSKNRLKVGDSATLTLTIKGDGNVKDVTLPEMNWPQFKMYDDKPQLKIGGSERLIGIKEFKKALVPIQEGLFTIPEIKISYFDTELGEYRYLKTEPLSFEILPGEASKDLKIVAPVSPIDENKFALKKEIKLVGKDLMPLMQIDDALSSLPFNLFELILLWFLFLGMPFSYCIVYFWKQRRERFLQDSTLLLQEKAYSFFSKRLKKVSMDGPNFFAEISNILREYLGNKLRLEGSAITPVDAERILFPFNMKREIIDEIKSLLRECDMAQYGGMAKDQKFKIEIKLKLESIVKKIEKEARL